MQRLFLPLCCALSLDAAAAPCLPAADLIARDAQYEEALRVGDVAFLQELLAEEYVWVHTLASAVDTKPVVLERARAKAVTPKSRTTSEVQAHALGDTVVLRGLSTVEQFNADGKSFRSARYQFMRTYVNLGGQCRLLAVQTMKLWSSEGK